MNKKRIDVIATTISGSVKDWGKVEQIVPLFRKFGEQEAFLFPVDSHQQAREKTCELIQKGSRILISAGGSGTFNSVLEGCLDSKVDLKDISLGFLRKGSADLIGKALGMSDDIEEAVKIFVECINEDRVVACDVIEAVNKRDGANIRHFVGYGGAELFGRIPHFTENRFIKYYKGILGQLFGDLGPFSVGAVLASASKTFGDWRKGKTKWKIRVDDELVANGFYGNGHCQWRPRSRTSVRQVRPVGLGRVLPVLSSKYRTSQIPRTVQKSLECHHPDGTRNMGI